MSTLAKVFVVLNLFLAVAFLGAAAAFLGHSDNWKVKHDKVKDDLGRDHQGSVRREGRPADEDHEPRGFGQHRRRHREGREGVGVGDRRGLCPAQEGLRRVERVVPERVARPSDRAGHDQERSRARRHAPGRAPGPDRQPAHRAGQRRRLDDREEQRRERPRTRDEPAPGREREARGGRGRAPARPGSASRRCCAPTRGSRPRPSSRGSRARCSRPTTRPTSW